MISIRFLEKHHINEILKLQVDNEQIAFSAAPATFVQTQQDGVIPCVIFEDGQLIGYFKLDTHFSYSHSFCPAKSLGLRTLLIDTRKQGKGVGTQAMFSVITFIKVNFSQYDFLYLTVNCKNPSAYHCYIKAGFVDTNELYEGGSAGPQHIMKVNLKPI